MTIRETDIPGALDAARSALGAVRPDIRRLVEAAFTEFQQKIANLEAHSSAAGDINARRLEKHPEQQS